ncbi:MAG TPA: amidohydrolase [Algoriphagus sp.]|jgi:amidohydrolase|uniref:amidohydrolase n=3 Tax=Algoriphagus TaxID=246875 RepID=UPI000C3ACEBC|nr:MULTISPECIES: amidohydrolase [unclassified Algoriphagus]MAL14405.1 N-acyl-L-amino acid amidohydrolase [Algoriphagus sp.]QYH40952.1 amidohydrolase [Algoriphagus sp. NBT04N3]HAD53099.1 amidohydrolase [Algoriphagus sp.]HCD89805.1 amidohydrolase [Algoriphagus sp.]HCH43858.1 amidohydrolase [Algoriphagus sp.]|tara:strand:+ start:3433 stop:4722 length:1290 start_codon:yes stop_codon:yes gene_type:complete
MKRLILPFLLLSTTAFSQSNLKPAIDKKATSIESKVIEWRRDFHKYPELGNQEFRTAKVIAEHLRSLGMEVTENVAVTGVVGVLKGGKPGPMVALRADMDALPVTERNDLLFKSVNTATYNGQETGVMHACGHDSHMAILMGVAEVMASMKDQLKGSVKFIFQPAEEGVYDADIAGAELMVKEGVMEDVDAIFGLHIWAQIEAGKIGYRSGPFMAAVDNLNVTITGTQAHGASPWSSVDPIVTSAQAIMGLQTILSRNVNITENPAVVTVGAIHGGIRHNIIPEKVEMIGTIRTFGDEQQALVHRRITEIITNIAESAGAKADVNIGKLYPSTVNPPELTAKVLPSVESAAGKGNVIAMPPVTGAEDFSFFQREKPGFFFFLGGMKKGGDPLITPSHHTPDFFIDESGFLLGVRTLSYLTVDYMEMNKK